MRWIRRTKEGKKKKEKDKEGKKERKKGKQKDIKEEERLK